MALMSSQHWTCELSKKKTLDVCAWLELWTRGGLGQCVEYNQLLAIASFSFAIRNAFYMNMAYEIPTTTTLSSLTRKNIRMHLYTTTSF